MSDTVTESPDGRRSWGVALVGAVAMVFTFGTVYSYGVFLDPFSEAYGLDPVVLSTVFAGMLFSFYIGAGVIGVFAARVSSRIILLACTGVSGIVAPSLYLVESYVGLVIVFVLLGLSLGTVFVILASVVPVWFDTHRGIATGLIFAGNGLGLFVLPPTWQFVIERSGVSDGFFLIMSITTVTFAVSAVTCRRPSWLDRTTTSTEEMIDWLDTLIKTRAFHLLFLGMGLSFGWYQLLTVYAIDLFTSRGLTAATASIAFGLIGGVSLISRLGSGYVADRVGFRRSFLASLGCALVGATLLFFPQTPVLILSIVCLGIGLGGSATLYIPVLMESYGRSKDTAIIGVFNIGMGVFSLAVPPIGAASVAFTGSYVIAILLTVLALAGAIWAVSAHTRYPTRV